VKPAEKQAAIGLAIFIVLLVAFTVLQVAGIIPHRARHDFLRSSDEAAAARNKLAATLPAAFVEEICKRRYKTLSGPASRRGKVLVVNSKASSPRIHACWRELPDSLRAHSPEEVETLVLLDVNTTLEESPKYKHRKVLVTTHTFRVCDLVARTQRILRVQTWPNQQPPSYAEIIASLPVH